MNILIYNWRDIKHPKKGGAEIILYELAKRLALENHSVTWFSQSFPGAKSDELFEGISIVRRGGTYSVFFKAFTYYRSLKKKPDIVLDCINTMCWQTPIFVERNKRILYANQSAREVFFYEYTFPVAFLGYVLEPLQYLTYKNTRALCYSKSIREDLVRFGLPKNNVSVFSLGIDHSRYKPGKKAKTPTFVFVARFVRNKRSNLCIEAIEIVRREFPDVKLYLVGYGYEELSLKKTIQKKNLSKNIIIVNKNNVFLKRDLSDAKVKCMQEAWAHLLFSVKEGWGMVVTEAAACGTPSIVSNVTGLKDSVINGKTGIVLSKNPTSKEIADSLIVYIKNEKMRETLSKNAVIWGKKFTWEESYQQFKQVILKK